MNRRSIELRFLGVLLIVSTVLFFKGRITKTEYYDLDTNPVFQSLLYLIMACLVLFNHVVMGYKLITNLVISIVIIPVGLVLSHLVLHSLVGMLMKLDNQVTPLGWHFKYKWYHLFVYGAVLIALSEWGYNRLKSRRGLYR
jgi:hypothetical protein